MFRFLPYVLKTLWRHRARTFLTAGGAAAALFVFCFVGAVQQGMHDLRRRQADQAALIVFQANKFCPATSHLPQDYDRRILDLDGVREVAPIQVFTNNCRASLDVVVFYGLPPDKLRRVRDFTLQSGAWDDFERRQDAAVVGRAFAARRGIEAGDRFTIGDLTELTVHVAGVFASDDPAEENYIYCHLDFLQRGKGLDRVGKATQFEVLLAPGVDAAAKCRQIDELFRGGPVATDTRPKGVFQAQSLGDLTQLIGLAHYLGYACVGLMLMLVATTTVMSVQDRVKEHAVLQTIGFSGPRVFQLVVAESLLVSFAGGVLGVGAAMATLAVSSLSVAAEAVAVAFRPSLELAAIGLAVSLATGLIAGLAPALSAARTEIVPALRQP